MIKIIRYSKTAFCPQKQSHHIHGFEYWKSFDVNSPEVPEHLRDYLLQAKKEKIKFYEEHFNDLQEGLWFFIKGHKNRQSLNHLKELVPCWEAEIEEDIMVYHFNLDAIVPITDASVLAGGCYIPKRLLCKILNIHRVQNHKNGN